MIRRRDPNRRVLRPLFPNAGLAAAYRSALDCLIEDMHASISRFVVASYRKNEPNTIVGDEAPVRALNRTLRELVQRWQTKFNEAAPKLGAWFAKAAAKRSDDALRSILREGGQSVRFRMTRAARDAIQATISAQVGLIRSIPARYLTDVEGAVMRSVQTGRDLGALSKDLRAAYGVTKRRAALISRDQNNKATATMNRARQIEIGIGKAVWLHSRAGKEPRPSHVRMDGKTYDPAKGMWDEDEGRYVLPGELINCRCTSRSVVEGFS